MYISRLLIKLELELYNEIKWPLNFLKIEIYLNI